MEGVEQVGDAELGGDAEGGDVHGVGERAADGDGAAEALIEVGRLEDGPVELLPAGGHIPDHRAGVPGAGVELEGGEVGERFDRGAGRVQGGGEVDLAIEFFGEEVAAADHRADRARGRIQRDQGAVVRAGVLLKAGDALLQLALREPLEAHVERGGDAQAAVGEEPAAVGDGVGHGNLAAFAEREQLVAHVEHEMGRGDFEFLGVEGERREFGGVGFGLGDVAVASHQVEHISLAALAPFVVFNGVVEGGGLGQAGEHRGFGEGEVGGRFAEVALAGGADAVGEVAVENAVEVPLENLFFGVFAGEFDGEDGFLDFAADALDGAAGAFFDGDQDVFDELLGDRGAAGAAEEVGAADAEVFPGGAEQAA